MKSPHEESFLYESISAVVLNPHNLLIKYIYGVGAYLYTKVGDEFKVTFSFGSVCGIEENVENIRKELNSMIDYAFHRLDSGSDLHGFASSSTIQAAINNGTIMTKEDVERICQEVLENGRSEIYLWKKRQLTEEEKNKVKNKIRELNDQIEEWRGEIERNYSSDSIISLEERELRRKIGWTENSIKVLEKYLNREIHPSDSEFLLKRHEKVINEIDKLKIERKKLGEKVEWIRHLVSLLEK